MMDCMKDTGANPYTTKPETDPTGRDAHEPGAKLDAGKPRLGMVLGGFARALDAVGEVGTLGAEKYSDGGWRDVPNGEARYTDAMLRHWIAEARGETRDPQLGVLHAAQLAWNALARLELMLSRSAPAFRADPAALFRVDPADLLADDLDLQVMRGPDGFATFDKPEDTQ